MILFQEQPLIDAFKLAHFEVIEIDSGAYRYTIVIAAIPEDILFSGC